jgi:hypothetical protein
VSGIVDLARERALRRRPAQRRNRQGRWTGRPLSELFDVLRAGAKNAKLAHPRERWQADTVPQVAWNSVAPTLESTYGAVGRAHGIAQAINAILMRDHGLVHPLSWGALVKLALDDSQDIEKKLQRLAARIPLPATMGNATFSFLRVLRRHGGLALSRHEFDNHVRALVDSDPTLRGALLESKDIERLYGSWEAATAAHGALPKHTQAERPRGLAIPRASALFYAERGYLPSYLSLSHFADIHDLSLRSNRGRTWQRWMEVAERYVALFPQLPPPPRYGPQFAPGPWTPIQIDVGPLPPRGTREYTDLAIDRMLLAFDEWLEGREPTDRRYRSFSTGRRGTLALSQLRKRGPLREQLLAARARRADRPELDQPALLRPDSSKESLAKQASEAVQVSPLADALVRVLREAAPLTAKQLATETGWSVDKVRYHLHALLRAGLVQPVIAARRSPHQAYRLPSAADDSER